MSHVFDAVGNDTGRAADAAVVEQDDLAVPSESVALTAPLVAQILRWDRLNDPLGGLSGFAERVDAVDDPVKRAS